MKEINGYLLCDVPEGAKDIEVIAGNGTMPAMLHYNQREGMCIVLPKGNYSIVGLAKDLTEEQWKVVVDFIVESDGAPTPYTEFYEYYKNYCGNGKYKTATESGHSLLKANNLNPNTTLILKKIL